MGTIWRAVLLGVLLTVCCGTPASGLTDEPVAPLRLDAKQSIVFRAWMVRIINEQIRQGPTPRWYHRDCAGLVRFAVAETLRPHDAKWIHANGIANHALPPDLQLAPGQEVLRAGWTQLDGRRAPFATAQILVQQNSRLVSRDLNQAQPGDLLFFDQGDDQHVMVWTGRYIAYHTGAESPTDNGLRAVTMQQLMQWKDTRWRPQQDNPNFGGVFRLAFLSR